MLQPQQGGKIFQHLVVARFAAHNILLEGTAMDYSGLDIFNGIANSEVEAMVRCFCMRQGRYGAGEVISAGGSGEVGVVLRGAAELVRFDYDGNRTILERLEAGGVFGEMLAFTPDLGDTVEVVSRGCEVLFMAYAHIMKRCEKACAYHSQLVRNMFQLLAGKSRRLSRRVEVLSRRSIRDKLLCYFRIRSLEAGSDSFELPFSLSALAEYISADRSAMMRELRKMRAEGLVEAHGRQIQLSAAGKW